MGFGRQHGQVFALPQRRSRLPSLVGRRKRASASPSAAIVLMQMNSEIDISAILPSIHVPTLVIHRSHDAVIDINGGRQLAALIPNAQLFEPSGVDHTPWTGEN